MDSQRTPEKKKSNIGFAQTYTIAIRILLSIIFIIGISVVIFYVRFESGNIARKMLLALILLFSYAGGMVLIGRLTKPLADLDELVKRVNAEVGERHPFREDSDSDNEFTLFGPTLSIENINQLFDEYLNIRDSEYSTLLLARQSQFAALQSQINPHYLYNTLDSIRGDAIVAGVPEIADVAEALSNFFRYSISQSEDFVLISQELENANNYFFIQKYRMGDRLTVDIDADMDELKKYYIPKLIIQPLLENSINYGLSPKVEPGKITIHVGISQSHVSIVVSDDGVGMNEETLEKIREA